MAKSKKRAAAKKPIKRFWVSIPSDYWGSLYGGADRWHATRASAEKAAMAASKAHPKVRIPIYELIAEAMAPVGEPQIKRYPT